MTAKPKKTGYTVSMLGTLPPIRALSSYCFELAHAVAGLCRVEFISFKRIYPSWLYPGGKPDDDHTYPDIPDGDMTINRRLTWYNPFSWLAQGLSASGDILHAQWWSMPLFGIYLTVCACAKLKKKPIVITVHNVLPHERSRPFVGMSKILFKLADHFIVHSRVNQRQLHVHYSIDSNKISVIAHGSLDFHVTKHACRTLIRKQMGFDDTQKIVLLFGAVRPYKGIDTAIAAFAETLAQAPSARLLIAGRLWQDWAPYQALIDKLDINAYVVTHLDYIPSGQVHQFFEAADLCIFPYRRFDSQSGAAAVALSFGKPMIVSSAGGLRDFVKRRRCIIAPGDHAALAHAMAACLQNPALLKQMTADTRALSAQFAWPQIARQTEKIYRRLLALPDDRH